MPARLRRELPAQPLETIGHLIQAGILPLLEPGKKESVQAYLARLGNEKSAYEWADVSLSLTGYAATGEGGPAEVERSAAEMVICNQGTGGVTWSCSRVRRRLARIHPLLLGSVLVHLSAATAHSWGVYTAGDALEDAETWLYEGSFTDYWRGIHTELTESLERPPTKAEVVEEAAQRCTTPGAYKRRIGLNEVIPAQCPRLRLGPDQIARLGRQYGGLDGALALELGELLTALYALNGAIGDALTDEDLSAVHALSSFRRSPLLVLSGQEHRAYRETDEGYVHLVQEQLEEVAEIAFQTEGFAPNVLIRVLSEGDARRAGTILTALKASHALLMRAVNLMAE